MSWPPIKKSPHAGIPAHIQNYEQTCATFSWDKARAELDGLPGNQGLNMAHEAVDRHAAGPRREHVALRWLGKNG